MSTLTLLWLVLDIWRCHGKEVAAHGSETITDLTDLKKGL